MTSQDALPLQLQLLAQKSQTGGSGDADRRALCYYCYFQKANGVIPVRRGKREAVYQKCSQQSLPATEAQKPHPLGFRIWPGRRPCRHSLSAFPLWQPPGSYRDLQGLRRGGSLGKRMAGGEVMALAELGTPLVRQLSQGMRDGLPAAARLAFSADLPASLCAALHSSLPARNGGRWCPLSAAAPITSTWLGGASHDAWMIRLAIAHPRALSSAVLRHRVIFAIRPCRD